MKYLIGLVAFLLIATPVSAAEFEKNIRFGSRGSEVSKLQEFLTEQGLYSYQITGNFFSLTLKSVKAFQSREGLPSTGFVGTLTRARINQILDEQLAEQEPEAIETKIETVSSTAEVIRAIEAQTKVIKEQNELLKSQTTTVIYVPVQTPETQTIQPLAAIPSEEKQPKIWTKENWDWSRTNGYKFDGKRLNFYFHNFSTNTLITVTLGSSTKSAYGDPKGIVTFRYYEEDDIWDKYLTQTFTLSGDDEGTNSIPNVIFNSKM